jgi:glycosyltransferase involved in cell wall biosynthesis
VGRLWTACFRSNGLWYACYYLQPFIFTEVAGEAALLVDPYKTEEITAAMQAIANDSKLRSHLCNLGINRASVFSWAKTGLATAEVLSRFL